MKFTYFKFALLLSAGCLLLFLSCAKEEDSILSSLKDIETPTISSIEPDVGYGGEEAVIIGSGFSTDPSENLITFGPGKLFGYKSVRPYEATATELKFFKPIISGPEGTNIITDVRVSLLYDADPARSNALKVTFKPLFFTRVLDEEIAWPGGIDVDADTNVYIGGRGDGVIYKIAKDGTKSVFVETETNGAMHFGPGGYLYFCNLDNDMIHRVSADGATVEDYLTCENPVDFDWDANGNLWIVSTEYWPSEDQQDKGVFVSTDGSTVTKVADIAGSGNVKSCRVYGNSLYVSGVDWDAAEGYAGFLYKYPINGAQLGTRENVVITEDDNFPLGLDIDKNGTIYYSKAWEPNLYTIAQTGAEGVMYEGELPEPSRFITYFGKAVYVVYPGWGDVGQVTMANIGVEQAPRYGRQ